MEVVGQTQLIVVGNVMVDIQEIEMFVNKIVRLVDKL
jgi:hypothetical protein